LTPPPQRPASATSPWSWARVVYAVLAPLALARGVDAASAALGVKGVGEGLRKWFGRAVGESDT
jgi:hypothetical protein